MIHFDLCIVGHRGPTSFFCMWTFSCPCTICWKDNPFVIELSSHTNQKSPDYKLEHLLPELSIIYHWSSVYLYTNTMLSWLLLLCSKFWSKKIWVFQLPFFFFFFKITLGILGLLDFHINLRISLSVITQINICGSFRPANNLSCPMCTFQD